jgi:hypothetical protein
MRDDTDHSIKSCGICLLSPDGTLDDGHQSLCPGIVGEHPGDALRGCDHLSTPTASDEI